MPHLLGEDEILERSLRFAKEAATMTPIFLLASFLTASMGRKGKPASLAEVAALFGRRFMPALTGLVALGREICDDATYAHSSLAACCQRNRMPLS